MDSIQAKTPAYLPSATARRAEEMLSSLGGESLELNASTSSTKETKEKVDSENRKRKLKPKYDLDEVSNVLGSVADEFKDILEGGGGRPGYPLTSLFGMSQQFSPKMIRFEFDAKDGDDKSNHNTVKRRRVETLPPNNNNDIDEITRRASYVNDTRESQQTFETRALPSPPLPPPMQETSAATAATSFDGKLRSR